MRILFAVIAVIAVLASSAADVRAEVVKGEFKCPVCEVLGWSGLEICETYVAYGDVCATLDCRVGTDDEGDPINEECWKCKKHPWVCGDGGMRWNPNDFLVPRAAPQGGGGGTYVPPAGGGYRRSH